MWRTTRNRKTGRRATGIVFATIGFALKAGLSIGAYLLLTLLAGYGYQANAAQSEQTQHGIRLCCSIIPAVMFAVCTLLLLAYKINKYLTIQIADDLAKRRAENAAMVEYALRETLMLKRTTALRLATIAAGLTFLNASLASEPPTLKETFKERFPCWRSDRHAADSRRRAGSIGACCPAI